MFFYDENEISQHLSCPNCATIFEDPRVVTCGETFCNNCVNNILKENDMRFVCPSCKEEHQIPNGGFPANRRMANQVKMKPSEFYRGKVAEELKSILKKLNELEIDMEIKLEATTETIKTHCEGLRNDVQLAKESAVLQIEAIYEDCFKQIDQYESKCLKIAINKRVIDKFKERIKEVNKFTNEWTVYLRKLKLDEEEMSKSIQEAEKLKVKLESDEIDLRSLIFDSKILLYRINETKIEAKLLGSFSYCELMRTLCKFSSLKSIDLSAVLNEKGYNTQFQLSSELNLIDNGNFSISFQYNTSTISLLLFNSTGGLIKNYLTNQYGYNTIKSKVETNKNFTLIYENKQNYYFLLTLLDDNFNQTAHLNTGLNKVIAISLNDRNVFVINNQIHRFDLSLVNRKSIGQTEDPNMPFYFSSDLVQFRASFGKFYLLYPNKLVVMNENTGKILRFLNISGNRMYVDSTGDLIVLDETSKLGHFIDEKTFKSRKLNLDGFSSNLSIVYNENLPNKIAAFDKISKVFYK